MTLIVDGLGGQSSLTVTPAAITTTEVVAHQLKIQANEMGVGTSFRVVAFGTISATSAGTVTARLRIGTAGTIADTQVAAPAAAGAVTAAVGWTVTFVATVRSTGSGGTMLGNGQLTVSGTLSQISAQVSTVAANTTVANFLSLGLVGGGTSPSITITNAGVEIVKP